LDWRLWVGKTPVAAAPATSTAPVGRPVVRCQSESTLNIGKAAHAQPFLTRAEPPAPVPVPSARPALNRGLRRSSTLPAEAFVERERKSVPAVPSTEPMHSGEGHQLSFSNIAQQDQLMGSPELTYEFIQASLHFFLLRNVLF
jgi:hypothetical protein